MRFPPAPGGTLLSKALNNVLRVFFKNHLNAVPLGMKLESIHKISVFIENTEQRHTGIRNVSGMERFISIGQVQPRKVVHLERWSDFFETFPF